MIKNKILNKIAKYEYKECYIIPGFEKESKKELQELNALSEKGWEQILTETRYVESNIGTGIVYVYILRKQIND